jgi:hypothetical protein
MLRGFEVLENRKFFSATLNGGTLTVTGTNNDDQISLSLLTQNNQNKLRVNDNGVNRDFVLNAVKKVVASLLNGDDTFAGGDNVNIPMQISGGAGNDVLKGGGRNDTMNGDAGNDTLDGRGGDDDMRGGAGSDTVDYSDRTNSLVLSLDDVANDGGSGAHDNIHSDIENVRGGQNDDVITGSAANNVIQGMGGTDQITGQGGDDAIYGGLSSSGDVPANHGTDVIDGGDGNDAIFAAPFGNATIFGGAGNDQEFGGIGNDYLNAWTGSDDLNGGGGNDIIRGGRQTTDNCTMSGGDGNDSLYGGAGADSIDGNDGADTIIAVGGGQSDFIRGGMGTDSIWCDAESTEKLDNPNFIDALVELLAGSVHRVDSFANGAGRDLNGENLADPSDGTGYVNFSSHPLFASTGPGKDDIRQGSVGDCWLMATLSATAKVSPMRIQQTVVPLGDGTYGVDFMRRNGGHEFYRVDADLPTWSGTEFSGLKYAKAGAEGSIWVPIIEKAYTFYRKHLNTYASIDGGWSYDAFESLRAKPADVTNWGNLDSVMAQISTAMTSGKAVTVASKVTPAGDCPCIGNHVYTVDSLRVVRDHRSGTTVTTWYITLRNPWGYDGAGNDNNTSDGYVTITGQQLMANFTGGVTCAV